MPKIYVPVVYRNGRMVDLHEVVARASRPAEAFPTEVSDAGLLCASVKEVGLDPSRGEKALDAYILARTREHAERAITGRSCALGMALASLAAEYGRGLSRDVVATGDVAMGGAVGAVAHLMPKLEKALSAAPEALILFPRAQFEVVDREHETLSRADLDRLERRHPGARERLQPVGALSEAANLAFGARCFEKSDWAEHRARVERLRFDRGAVAALFEAARDLCLEARRLPEGARFRINLEFQALSLGAYAAGQRRRDVCEWPGIRSGMGNEIGKALYEQAERMLADHAHLISPDLRAEYLNFRAGENFGSSDFLAAIARLEEALRIPGLLDGVTTEKRRLKGTRAQFAWRQAMRMLAVGMEPAARHYLDLAREDIGCAVKEAERQEVPDLNDRARVRIYELNYLQAEEVFQGKVGLHAGKTYRTLREVLGRLFDPRLNGEPQQESGWGIQRLYLQLANEGKWEQLIAHWRQVRNVSLPDPNGCERGGKTLLERIRQLNAPVLPCDRYLAAFALEAAIRTGAREEAEDLARRAGSLSQDSQQKQRGALLLDLANFWPVAEAPRDWNLEALQWVREWADGYGQDVKLPVAGERDRWLAEQLDLLRRAHRAGDRGETARVRRLLRLWLGEPVAEEPPRSDPKVAPPKLIIEKGATVPFEQLPENSVALDGYVQGPRFDAARRRYSFDHHAGCSRHATLSTCEMTLDALRLDLDPAGMTVFLNDLDADSVLSAWLLCRPAAAREERVAAAVRAAGRFDALGPASGGAGLVPALRWALAPVLDRRELRARSEEDWRRLLEECFGRLDPWRARGAPERHPDMDPGTRERPEAAEIDVGEGWVLASTEEASATAPFPELYKQWRAAVVVRRAPHETWEYAVGKASEFVGGFDVPAVLKALAEEELRVNPAQSSARNWGGGSTIGGSPRNADGSASRLSPERVFEVVQRVVGRKRDPERTAAEPESRAEA